MCIENKNNNKRKKITRDFLLYGKCFSDGTCTEKYGRKKENQCL